MSAIVGWDLGGANLKLALMEGARVTRVEQIPCPLVPHRGKFDTALAETLKLCPEGASHAVTMTGELSDVFEDRAEGVAYLVGLMREAVGGAPLLIYGGRAGFLDPDDAVALPMDVASANWHASATLAAALCPDGLFVDMGTTTTDLVPLKAGEPATRGYSDGERLTEHELLYTGAVRTPVMAVAREAPFKGRSQRIAAERFATMADVFRLLGALPDDADPYPSADLCCKTTQASASRLARMLGRDAGEAGLYDWIDVARHFADCQFAEIEAAARALVARETLAAEAPVIGAGCGRFVAKRLAKQLGLAYADFAALIDCAPEAAEMASRSAPAVSVALLSARAYP
ncbi:hydantoinase/oxoprolinase family protein [Methyloceanibacter sp.]|uniref:hydantoinase/oxoprolinase family protein n=1 Tax=Methyloceanibacter sp. TaxID=1965321 RepID=UPI00351B91A2